MKDRRLLRAQAVILTVAACSVAAPAVAAGPVIERIPIDVVTVDEFLSEECGVEVTVREKGQLIIRTFDDDGQGPLDVFTINVGVTATAGDNTVRFRDVGADLLRREPDGTLVLQVIGQVPFEFTGVLKLNPDTGEVLHEPQRIRADQLEEVCAALTA